MSLYIQKHTLSRCFGTVQIVFPQTPQINTTEVSGAKSDSRGGMYDTQPCKFKQNDKHTLGHATDLMYLSQFFRLKALSLKTAVLPLGCRCTYSDNPQLIDLVGLTKFDMC